MAEKGTQDPTTGTESDISKAQAQQQPQQESKKQPETGEQREFETGEAESGEPDEGLQSDTLAEQRTDIEGTSTQSEKGEAESGIIGSKGEADTSGEFVEKKDEDKQDLSPEGE